MLKVFDCEIQRKFLKDQRGSVSLESGMIASIIAIAIATSVSSVGNGLGASFKVAADAVSADPTPDAPPPAGSQPNVAPIPIPTLEPSHSSSQ